MSTPRSSLKLWRASTFTSASVFGDVVKPMRGDAVETRRRGSRGASLGEDEGQERIGLRAQVTLRTSGTDPAVAQTPGVQFVCCLGLLYSSLLAAFGLGRSKIRTDRSRQDLRVQSTLKGSGQRRGSASALLIRWLAAVAAECFGIWSRASDS